MIKLITKLKRQQPSQAMIMRQLASLISAGVPIAQCLAILEQTHQHTDARIMFFKIKRQLLAGNSLYDSLRSHSQVFDNFTCHLIQLGERTGKLDKVLLMLAKHHEDRAALGKKIRQALFYPCLICCAAIIMTVCLFVFVIPSFAQLFKDADRSLPLLTRAIFSISSLLQHGWPAFCVFVFALSATSFYAYRRGRLTAAIEAIYRYAPLIRKLREASAMTHFSRHLAITLAAGIPILESLQLSAEMCSDRQLATIIRQLRAAVSAGVPLHEAMAIHQQFPAMLQQMVKVGEASGNIDHMLEKSADLLAAELDTRIQYLTQLLEPLIMTLLGVLIGGLVTGMYLPVFNLGSTL
jgi:type IV pilus assembly protein PilC